LPLFVGRVENIAYRGENGDTNKSNVTIRNFEIVDENEETESSSGNTIPVVQASRGDVELEDVSVESAHRQAVTGSPSVSNVSGV
jgi:hypothetical protein